MGTQSPPHRHHIYIYIYIYIISYALVEIWGRDPWLSPIGHIHTHTHTHTHTDSLHIHNLCWTISHPHCSKATKSNQAKYTSSTSCTVFVITIYPGRSMYPLVNQTTWALNSVCFNNDDNFTPILENKCFLSYLASLCTYIHTYTNLLTLQAPFWMRMDQIKDDFGIS